MNSTKKEDTKKDNSSNARIVVRIKMLDLDDLKEELGIDPEVLFELLNNILLEEIVSSEKFWELRPRKGKTRGENRRNSKNRNRSKYKKNKKKKYWKNPFVSDY